MNPDANGDYCDLYTPTEKGMYVTCNEKGKKGENPHRHVYLMKPTMPESWYRSDLRVHYGKAGNKMWSLKLVSDEKEDMIKTIAYLMKEGDYKIGPAVPAHLVFAAEKLNEQYKEKKKPQSLYKDVMDHFQDIDNPSYKEVIEYILDQYILREKVINTTYVVNLTHTVLYKYREESRDVLIHQIQDRLGK